MKNYLIAAAVALAAVLIVTIKADAQVPVPTPKPAQTLECVSVKHVVKRVGEIEAARGVEAKFAFKKLVKSDGDKPAYFLEATIKTADVVFAVAGERAAMFVFVDGCMTGDPIYMQPGEANKQFIRAHYI